MSAPAPILIPFEAEDNTGAAFDHLNSGFDNLLMQAEAADRAFAGLADQADGTGASLDRFGTALDALGGQFDTAATAADRLMAAINGMDPLSKVSGIDAMADAYGRLADQMHAAALAGQGIHSPGTTPAVGGMPTVAGGGGLLSPADQLSQDAAMHSLHSQGLVDDQGNPIPQAAHQAASGHGGVRGLVAGAFERASAYGGIYLGYSAVKDSLSRVQATDYAAAGEGTQLGMAPGAVADMQTRNAALQMSGQTVYDQMQLNQALYTPATFGAQLGGQQVVDAIGLGGVQLAQVTGSADPAAAESAITFAQLAYGGRTTPTHTQDLLVQENVQSGFHLDQIAANAGKFLPGAAQRDISEADAFAAYGNMSSIITDPGQAGADFGALERELGGNANAQEKYYGRMFGINLSDASLVKDSGGYENLLKMIDTRTDAAGPEEQKKILTSMFGAQGGQALYAQIAGGFGTFDTENAAGGKRDASGKAVGAFGAAWEDNQANASVQLAESENKLKGEFDHLTEQLLPLEKPLLDGLGSVAKALGAFADALSGPGGLTDYTHQAGDTFKHFTDPTDPAFGKIDQARQESAGDTHKAGYLQPQDVGAPDPAATAGTGGWNPLDVHTFGLPTFGLPQVASAIGGTVGGWFGGGPPAGARAATPAGAAALPGYHVPTGLDAFSLGALEGNITDPLAAPTAADAGPTGLAGGLTGGAGDLSGAAGTQSDLSAIAHFDQSQGQKGGASADIRKAKEDVLALISGGAPDDQVWQAMGFVHDALYAQPGGAGLHGADYGKFRASVVRALGSRAATGHKSELADAHRQLADMQDQFRLDLRGDDFSGARQEEGQILSFEGSNMVALGIDGYAVSMAAEGMQGQLATGEQGQARTQAAAKTKADRDRIQGEQRHLKDLHDHLETDRARKDTAAYRRDVGLYEQYQGQHMADFGLDQSDIGLETAQLLGLTNATPQMLPGQTLIRPGQVDTGSALAGYEGGAAQLSRIQASNPLAEQLTEMRRTNEHLTAEIAAMRGVIDQLEDGKHISRQIVQAIYETAGGGPAGPPAGKQPRRGGI